MPLELSSCDMKVAGLTCGKTFIPDEKKDPCSGSDPSLEPSNGGSFIALSCASIMSFTIS